MNETMEVAVPTVVCNRCDLALSPPTVWKGDSDKVRVRVREGGRGVREREREDGSMRVCGAG
jgi:hypothetical protein